MSTRDDIEVRLVDQQNINEFGRLNNRLLEIKADIFQAESDVEKLDDATSELMMVSGDKVMILIGDSFIETTQDFANEYCERKTEEMQAKIKRWKEEKNEIISRQSDLKATLYGRFGDSINLEN